MEQYDGIFTYEDDGNELIFSELEQSDFEMMGYPEIKNTYGNPSLNGKLNKEWYNENIILVDLPFPMVLAWDKTQSVNHVLIHKKLADKLVDTLTDVYNYARIQTKKIYPNKTTAFYNIETIKYLSKYGLNLFGGTFAFRPKRGSKNLSLHAFGICIDINPANNAMGTKGNMPEWFVTIWKSNGWTYGGDWKGSNCDSMHFQMAKGA